MNFYIKLLFRLISDIFQLKEFKIENFLNGSYKSLKNISSIKKFIIKTYHLKNIINLSGKLNKISEVYNLLEDYYSKKILIELISGYILGFKYVKLTLNNDKYWMAWEKVNNLINGNEILWSNTVKLNHFNLKKIGIPIRLFCNRFNIINIFLLQQYRYDYKKIIDAKEGDLVIDAGGCWGDTALFFANKVGKSGRVYSFEFIPSNIHILKENIDLNPYLKNIIQIVEYPLWNISNNKLYFIDKGVMSKVISHQLGNSSKTIKTISIDDYVTRNNIHNVDFIKMDIEGAELKVLIGAKDTLIKCKPKLAISIYHNINHFFEIPQFIRSLNINYKFYLDHFSTNQRETILFAKVV